MAEFIPLMNTSQHLQRRSEGEEVNLPGECTKKVNSPVYRVDPHGNRFR
jgi:hypothetical protein